MKFLAVSPGVYPLLEVYPGYTGYMYPGYTSWPLTWAFNPDQSGLCPDEYGYTKGRVSRVQVYPGYTPGYTGIHPLTRVSTPLGISYPHISGDIHRLALSQLLDLRIRTAA